MPTRKEKQTIYELLKSPEINFQEISQHLEIPFSLEIQSLIEVEVKYEGYISKIEQEIARLAKFEKTQLHTQLDYTQVKNLTLEAVEKLTMIKPETIGQASRIPGVTAVDISMLLIFLKSHKE